MANRMGILGYAVLLLVSLVNLIFRLRPKQLCHYFEKTSRKATVAADDEVKMRTVDDVPGPTAIPVFGTGWIYSAVLGKYKLNKIHDAYADLFATHGPILREEGLWNFPVISVCDRAAIERVIKMPCKYPMRPPTEVAAIYRKSRPDRYANLGLLNAQGTDWDRLRVLLTPQLRSTRTVSRLAQELCRIGDDFTALLRQERDKSGSLEHFELLVRRLGLESSCLLILGQRVGFLGDEVNSQCQELYTAICNLFEAFRDTYFGLPFWKIFPSKAYSLYVKSEEKIYDIMSEFVDEARGSEENVSLEDPSQCFFQSNLAEKDLDIREKKSTLIDFISSGVHPLGNTLLFALYLIAKHDDAQERLYQEICELAPDDVPITADNMRPAKYLRACVTEAYRLLPTATIVARVLDNNVVLCDYQLPTGTVVLLHSWHASLNEENFSDAKSFRPERWLAENKDQITHSPLFMTPFGFGKRICPAKRFAEQFITLIIAKLIKEFRIEYDGEIELIFEFLLRPKSTPNFKFTARVT